jgi:DNA invertase Pin-like site-specific DNA recombinase
MGWIAALSVLVASILVWILYRQGTKRLLELHGAEFKAYNETAFREIIEDSPEKNFLRVTRLARELESRRGQRAILVPALERGTAIHHINQNGTFSAKGPYFVSWRSGNWKHTNRVHLVSVLRGKAGWGFKPDHYEQIGVIREKGVAVLEYGTSRHPPLTIRDFARLQRKRADQ